MPHLTYVPVDLGEKVGWQFRIEQSDALQTCKLIDTDVSRESLGWIAEFGFDTESGSLAVQAMGTVCQLRSAFWHLINRAGDTHAIVRFVTNLPSERNAKTVRFFDQK